VYLDIFTLLGAPVILQSDNGSEFTAGVIKVSLREAVVLGSQCGGQGYVKCNCSGSKNVKQIDASATKPNSNATTVDATKV